MWDTTYFHRRASTYFSLAAQSGSTVAALAEKRKWDKYRDLAESYVVQPLAFETLGGVGPATWKFIRELGSHITSQFKDAKQALFLRQRLSVAIQVGNAACIMERILSF